MVRRVSRLVRGALRGSPSGRRRLATVMACLLVATLVLGGCKPSTPPGWTFRPVAEVRSPGASAGTASPEGSGPPVGSAAPPAAPSPSPASSAVPTPSAPVAPSASPVVAPSFLARRPDRLAVPILYYHRVSEPPRGFATWTKAQRARFLAYDVLPVAFEAQLDWLLANGYTTILPRDLAAAWDRGVPLPPKPVILTFDDGTHDWTRNILPALRERGMIAEFYVTLAALKSGGMSWPELRAIVAAGNGIGAHGLHHWQLTGFGGSRKPFTEAQMRIEVQQSRALLAKQLGVVPDSYSYVGGGQDATLRRLVAEAGYTTARSIIRGHSQEVSRRYLLRVIRIGSRLDVRSVARGTLVPGLPGFAKLMLGATATP